MNDGLEKHYLKKQGINNLFFASFLLGEDENIGMWSMYSQPWHKGIIIRIPIEYVKEWIFSDAKVFAADKQTKQAIKEINDYKILSGAVAYVNMNQVDNNMIKGIICGNQYNNKEIIMSSRVLGGYLKDKAWAYEREMRLRIETSEKCDGVCIEIPDNIYDSFEIITGPRYSGDLLEIIREEANDSFDNSRIKPSLFTGKLNWVYCDCCDRIKMDK